MESNFYNVFRNTLRIVLNSGIDKSIRAELLNIVNDPKIGYYQKLDILKDKLTEILSDYIEFTNINVDDVDDIMKCFGLNKKSCKDRSLCSFSDQTGNCKIFGSMIAKRSPLFKPRS